MIFSVQRFLEDYFERRGLTDPDQYAIRIANEFERSGANATPDALLLAMARLRTVFYRRNSNLVRKEFEPQIVTALRGRFKKKQNDQIAEGFENALGPARARLRKRPRSITALLSEFKSAIESRAVDVFWDSRKRNALRPRPEKIAQALLAVFAKGTIGTDGLVLREVVSGIGFVDIGISFGGVLHLIELKMLKAGKFAGANQLATYMKTEQRRKGWLVLIDSRKNRAGASIPPSISTSAGLIETLVVDVHPTPPNIA